MWREVEVSITLVHVNLNVMWLVSWLKKNKVLEVIGSNPLHWNNSLISKNSNAEFSDKVLKSTDFMTLLLYCPKSYKEELRSSSRSGKIQKTYLFLMIIDGTTKHECFINRNVIFNYKMFLKFLVSKLNINEINVF